MNLTDAQISAPDTATEGVSPHDIRPRSPGELPTKRPGRTRGGPETESFTLRLEVVTPILGGGPKLRDVDRVDIIRPPTIRGHLRFWWRALYALGFQTPKALFEAESQLFGRAAKEDVDEGRSPLHIRVRVHSEGWLDPNNVNMSGRNETPGSYVLWPAQKQKRTRTRPEVPPAPRRMPKTKETELEILFDLTISAPGDQMPALRNALRAWILFGGYGSRSRRGLGSLTVAGEVENGTLKQDAQANWLPAEATRDAINELFDENEDVFDSRKNLSDAVFPSDTPSLRGASLLAGNPNANAYGCWQTVLGWLKEFRQGAPGARAPDPTGQNKRASISNWPEADKIRHLSNPGRIGRWAHDPNRHNAMPAWPRAGFGLPIIGQFQKLSRVPRPGWRDGDREPRFLNWNELPTSHANYGVEPRDFELRLRSDLGEHNRLASALVLKPMPLQGRRFSPCALWLNRTQPPGACVELWQKGPGQNDGFALVANSRVDFDVLEAPGDTAEFAALRNRATLREAFVDWLGAKGNVHNLTDAGGSQ